MTTDVRDPETRLAAAHQSAMHYQRQRKRLEKRAGRAIKHYDDVLREQGEAIDVFSAGTYGDLTNEELGRAAGRIQRLSSMLVAADSIERARELEAEAIAHLTKVRDEVGAPTVRPVGGRSR